MATSHNDAALIAAWARWCELYRLISETTDDVEEDRLAGERKLLGETMASMAIATRAGAAIKIRLALAALEPAGWFQRILHSIRHDRLEEVVGLSADHMLLVEALQFIEQSAEIECFGAQLDDATCQLEQAGAVLDITADHLSARRDLFGPTPSSAVYAASTLIESARDLVVTVSSELAARGARS